MSEIIDIRYVLNPDEVASASDKIDRAVEGTQQTVEAATEDFKENINIQKQVLKELEQQYADTQKKVQQVAPGKARQELEAEMAAIRREIKAEKQALDELTESQTKHERSTRSLRTQIMELRNAMATMVEGSEEYNAAMLQFGKLKDQYDDINQQGRVFADDEKYYRATTEAIQAVSGAMSIGVGVASLFGASQENLAKIQARLQSVMAISIGVQQLAQVLNKDSYLSHLLLAKIKAVHATATGFLSKSLVAMGVSATVANVAAKALLITLTGGLILAITAVVSAIGAWSDSQEENRKKTEEARKAQEEFAASVASTATPQIVTYEKLRRAYSALGNEVKAKQKFIKENQDAFRELGVAVDSVREAENLLIDNAPAFIASIQAKSMALAYMDLAKDEYSKIIQKQVAKEQRLSAITEEDKQSGYNKLNEAYVGKGVIGRAQVSKNQDKYIQKGVKESQQAAAEIIQKDIDAGFKKVDQYFSASESTFQGAVEKLEKAGIKSSTSSNKDNSSAGLSLVKAARDRQWAIEQARIDAMNEGSAKQLAQIDLNHQKELERLKEQRAEAVKMAASIGDKKAAPQIKAEFATLEQASTDKAMRDRLAVTKQMQEAIVSELQKEVDQTLLLYGQELDAKWAYLEQYGTVEQQRYAITMQYGQKIAQAKSEWQKKQLEQEKEAATKAVDLKALQQSAPFAVLFDNLDTSGTATINQAIKAARTLLDATKDSGTYTAEQLKVLYDALGKAETEVRKRNPFAALGQAVEAWDKKDPRKSFSTLASAAGSSLSLVGDSLNIVVGGLKEMGLAGDEETQKILDDSVKLIGGFGDIATGLATMNPTQILQGAMSAFTALWSLFDEKGRQADRIIKDSQAKIDTLKERYQVLGEAVEKAYSQDASKLIEDQNVLLEQQKQLIKNQIAAEQSRKDGGDASKVKEWQQAIKDIDKTVTENKEKAVDAIFGADVQSAINDFASAYLDAYGAGEDRAASQKEVVKKMIQGMVAELVKSNIADKVASLRTALKNAILDGVISDTEQAAIDKIQEEIYAQSEKDAKSYDKWLKGDEDQTKNENSFTGAIRGSVATEASVAELGGIFRGQYDKLASIDGKMTMGMSAMMELARTNAAIELNTRATAANTAQTVAALVDGFKEIKGELTAIKTNTSKDTGSYGG